jgi:hypothetical protein
LYRNPDPVQLPAFPGLVARVVAAFHSYRRRRRTTVDLMALSGHMRRDLGLEDFPFRERR